jgi:hypothetical protein
LIVSAQLQKGLRFLQSRCFYILWDLFRTVWDRVCDSVIVPVSLYREEFRCSVSSFPRPHVECFESDLPWLIIGVSDQLRSEVRSDPKFWPRPDSERQNSRRNSERQCGRTNAERQNGRCETERTENSEQQCAGRIIRKGVSSSRIPKHQDPANDCERASRKGGVPNRI